MACIAQARGGAACDRRGAREIGQSDVKLTRGPFRYGESHWGFIVDGVTFGPFVSQAEAQLAFEQEIAKHG